MKILKYFLIVILLLTTIFLAIGFFIPSISYETEVTVDKSAAEAWAVMSDESKLSQWIKGFKKTELVSGEINTVGAVSNIYVEEQGRDMIMKETITAIKPNEQMAMNFWMDFMNMDYELNLNENEGKTKITTKTTTEGNGVFAKSLVAFMKSTMKLQEDQNLSNLKKLINSNTTNYFEAEQLDTTSIEQINQ